MARGTRLCETQAPLTNWGHFDRRQLSRAYYVHLYWIAEAPQRARRLQEDLGSEYVVMGELGSGGFAKAFLVRESARGTHLAVKVMHRALMLSSTFVCSFQREIRCASELDHPNIVPVTFSRERADLVYYAMPRVRGKTLKKHIEELGQLSVQEMLHKHIAVTPPA